MEAFIELLTTNGYWGMLLAAFLAGSFIPYSSEAVMLMLLAAGLDPWGLILYGTIGNVMGSVLNYYIGRMGKTEWIEKYLHVSQDKMAKAERFVAGRGAMMGFFAFIPILGSAITILLGLMRSNPIITLLSITLGKFLRYYILVFGVKLLF